MIRSLIFILFFLMVTASGSNTQEQDDPGVFESLSEIKDFSDYMEEISEEIDEMTEEGNALLVATPLTNDRLKTFLPENLHGLSRKKFSVGDQFLLGWNNH